MLQERQQGMAGVHGLEAAQQVSAVCLLAQVEYYQLGADLQQQRLWGLCCVFGPCKGGAEAGRLPKG